MAESRFNCCEKYLYRFLRGFYVDLWSSKMDDHYYCCSVLLCLPGYCMQTSMPLYFVLNFYYANLYLIYTYPFFLARKSMLHSTRQPHNSFLCYYPSTTTFFVSSALTKPNPRPMSKPVSTKSCRTRIGALPPPL